MMPGKGVTYSVYPYLWQKYDEPLDSYKNYQSLCVLLLAKWFQLQKLAIALIGQWGRRPKENNRKGGIEWSVKRENLIQILIDFWGRSVGRMLSLVFGQICRFFDSVRVRSINSVNSETFSYRHHSCSKGMEISKHFQVQQTQRYRRIESPTYFQNFRALCLQPGQTETLL